MIHSFGTAKKTRGKPLNTNLHHLPVPMIVKEIVEKSDIILEVLDSRFIDKTRSKELEKIIKRNKKVIIYVLNKADLVDTKKVKWKTELENLKPHIFFSSKGRNYIRKLRKLLEMESKKIKKPEINIGVIGYPNTGKSSLIKAFSVKSKIRISAESGHTRGAQRIKIAKGLFFIDTPGMIPLNEKKLDIKEKQSQIGAIDWNKAKNPELTIHNLMKEYPEILEKNYKIKAEGDSEILIEELGKKWHFFKKKNLVDDTRTAKKILRDWQEGKIKLE